MRWSLKLESPSLVAHTPVKESTSGWHESVAPTLQLGPDQAGRQARVWIAADQRELEFVVLASGITIAGNQPPFPEWYNRAHLVVMLNPNHDHAIQWQYGVADDGQVVRFAKWIAPGEEPSDTPTKSLDDPPEAHCRFTRIDDHRFMVRLRVLADDLFAEPARPVGLVVRVGFHEPTIPQPLAWPEPPAWTDLVPLVYGDLYRLPASLRVDRIELPQPTWEDDSSALIIDASLAADAPQAGVVRTEIILPGDSQKAQPDVAWRGADGRMQVRVPVWFPHRANWVNDVLATARLGVTIDDNEGNALWSADYPFGIEGGIVVRERFGPGSDPPPPRPEPSSPDFVNRFRKYILARMPDYVARTTRQGAPSDFYLENRAGRDHLDLLATDALDQAAAMLARRFGDWSDALCAAAMWIHHPHVTRHSPTWSRVSSAASIGTLLRLPGSFCCDTARLGACLAEKIGRQLGMELPAYSMGLRGHLCTLIDTPVGQVVIDGMLGLWYHTLDNTRLATLDEMRQCRQIVERVWYCPRAHGHEFFFGIDDQIIRPWNSGLLRWPEQAD